MKILKAVKYSEIPNKPPSETIDLIVDFLASADDMYTQVVLDSSFFAMLADSAADDPELPKENPRAWRGIMQLAKFRKEANIDIILLDLQ